MDLCDQKLKEVRDQVVACQKCSLFQARKYPVVGEGDHRADIMFIGEAPGRQEDNTGRPFCGAAGEVLTEILTAAGLDRKNVYIANILKCRPPNNRNPWAAEIEACVPYLDRQIEIIGPRVICPMGNFAVRYLMQKYGLEDQVVEEGKVLGVTRLKGRVFDAQDQSGRPLKIVPLYHPAVATYNANLKPELARDYRVAVKLLRD